MRRAEDVLNVIQDRGKRRLPLDGLYRQLYNPTLYLRAYGRIYRNAGAMTPGTTEETVDGMSMAKIFAIIEALRYERYRWTPVRRTYIPKKNGKLRPLGIPTWSDKLLQEVMRCLLEAYYEPQFSDRSHGFRPGRGCHSALNDIYHTWLGTKWFIEGDIKGCFDNIDHQVLLSILRENIRDNRFLRLIESLLGAGYLERWDYRPTLSGTPQGGIISPILSNIYLDRLDRFVEQKLIPEFTRGEHRRRSKEYKRLLTIVHRRRKAGRFEEAEAAWKELQRLPSGEPNDPDYRRLRYIRYADDFLLGFAGPKAEAGQIKEKLRRFLADELHLELSAEKTLITHATTQKEKKAARFLGYEIRCVQCDTKHDSRGARSVNGHIALRLPAEAQETRCRKYQENGTIIHRTHLLNDSDFSIVAQYGMEYAGYVNYYLLAQNVAWLRKLRWVMETSLLKTLAAKHSSSVDKMAKKYKATVSTRFGPRKCLLVTIPRENKEPLIARFGGLPLRRERNAVLTDGPIQPFWCRRTEIVKRLLAEECEVCGREGAVQVHHVRKLADLEQKGRRERPFWIRNMAARRRKTLVLCHDCHVDIHYGRPSKAMSMA